MGARHSWSARRERGKITAVLSAAIEAGTVLGEYRIEGLIAEGGMGSVYYATHPVIGKSAAVKVMRDLEPGALKRFVQEARAVNQISHPNIVDIFSFGELEDGRGYLVMELVDGECLAEVLFDGALPIVDVLAIVEQLADAIETAHRAGVVHRDLKPDNIMLVELADGRKQAKLLDFGIAKLADPDDESLMGRRTRTGLVLGTPNYMSPEQARGKDVDHRTDIYALGCVAFEMVTGRVPFQADNPTDAVIMHVQEPVPSLRPLRESTPKLLDKLVRAMLAKKAENRPTLQQVKEVLANIAATLDTRSPYASATFAERIENMRSRVTEVAAQMDAALATGVSPAARRGRGEKLMGLAVAAAVVIGVGVVSWYASAGLRQGAVARPADKAVSAASPSRGQLAHSSANGAATIEVAVNVESADVLIDGKLRGIAAPLLIVDAIEPGNHRIELRANGHRNSVRSVQVSNGQSMRITVDMVEDESPRAPVVEPKSRRRDPRRPISRTKASTTDGHTKNGPTDTRAAPEPVRKSSKSGPNDIDYTVDPFAK